jgi:hypothetical protein
MASQKNPPGPHTPAVPDPKALQQCQAAIRSLGIRRPSDLNSLLAAVENRRGRRLVLTAAAMAPACDGMWIATETTDYIVYEQDTTSGNQLRIISHEIGHMVLDHQGMPLASSDVARLFFPNLDPAMVATSLARSVSSAVYSPTEELEAEIFASLLVSQLDRSPFPR